MEERQSQASYLRFYSVHDPKFRAWNKQLRQSIERPNELPRTLHKLDVAAIIQYVIACPKLTLRTLNLLILIVIYHHE